MQIPSIGRIVTYVFPEAEGGMIRPAIIVRVWSDNPTPATAVQLQVFTDAGNDRQEPVVWKTSVGRGFGFGQYHFYDDPQESPV